MSFEHEKAKYYFAAAFLKTSSKFQRKICVFKISPEYMFTVLSIEAPVTGKEIRCSNWDGTKETYRFLQLATFGFFFESDKYLLKKMRKDR